MLGQEYGLTSNKLLRKNTVALDIGEDSDRQMIDKNRTFFCSEVVAKAFKVLGILKKDETSCARFWPNDFSARGGAFLKLTEGTVVGEEQRVIVDPFAEYVIQDQEEEEMLQME